MKNYYDVLPENNEEKCVIESKRKNLKLTIVFISSITFLLIVGYLVGYGIGAFLGRM